MNKCVLDSAPLIQQPLVSYNALKRARTTLEDFALSYLPYYGLTVHQDWFKYMDVLVFVEGLIYQLDEDNEAICRQYERCHLSDDDSSPGLQVVREFLAQIQVLNESLLEELDKGEHYWRMERSICARLADAAIPRAAGGGQSIGLEEVVATHEMKSFDYRVLHLLLCALAGRKADPQLIEFLKVDEMLVDISDDLVDYEDDVEDNSFNIYRGYVHVYGVDAPRHLVDRISKLEALHSKLLEQLPVEHQAHYWSRHKEASAEEGAAKWVFPEPIVDEVNWRKEVGE